MDKGPCGFGRQLCSFQKVSVQSLYIVSSDSILRFRQITCVHVRTIALDQNVAMPTIIPKFCEENFRDQKSNHEIHENIVPRKFGAIPYYCVNTRSITLAFEG